MKVKSLLTLILISLLIVGCRTKTGVFENGRYSKNMKEAFIGDFKTLSFCRCVENANDQQLDLAKEDVSCGAPDYLYSEIKIIDSLARKEADNIRRAEAERNYPRAEGMEGKEIISNCLAFYNSKQLEAIAKERFRISEKSMQSIGRN
jgi:hypothetical protein